MKSNNLEADVHFQRRGRGAKRAMEAGSDPNADVLVGRLVRITRLEALTILFDELSRNSEVTDYAELARLGHGSRSRVTQITNLLRLGFGIKEQIQHLPRVTGGRDSIDLRQLQPIALVPDWRK